MIARGHSPKSHKVSLKNYISARLLPFVMYNVRNIQCTLSIINDNRRVYSQRIGAAAADSLVLADDCRAVLTKVMTGEGVNIIAVYLVYFEVPSKQETFIISPCTPVYLAAY